MVTEEMLRTAAEEAERFVLTTLPCDEQHKFSSRFERKMAKLLRRANHPVRYQVMRSAAAVVLVLLTLFGAVRTVSPEIGSSSAGWFRQALSSLIQFISPEPVRPGPRYVYYLAEAPEGYVLQDVLKTENGKTYIYERHSVLASEGPMIRFSYTYGGDGNGLSAASENYHISAAAVGEYAAEVYIAKNSGEANMILWKNPSEGVSFSISAMLDEQALIELAESVKK